MQSYPFPSDLQLVNQLPEQIAAQPIMERTQSREHGLGQMDRDGLIGEAFEIEGDPGAVGRRRAEKGIELQHFRHALRGLAG